MSVWGIVVAAGSGTRFGAPKQFAPLGTARVVDHAVRAVRAACDAVVLVLPAGTVWDGATVTATVAGAATRSGSVRAGLEVVPDDADVIVVHDGARPLAGPAVFDTVIDAVRSGADGAVPVVAVVDTLKRADGDRVRETIARDRLVAVQTPQAFAAAWLRHAHAPRRDATDDAALVEAAGGNVVVVPGDARNRKITDRDDLLAAEALLAAPRASSR